MTSFDNTIMWSRKFYKYIFWMSPSPTLTYYLLMLFPVAIQKTTGQCSRKKRERKSSLSKKPFRSNHFHLKSDGKQHPCQYCKIYGITKDTTWHCQDCSTYVTEVMLRGIVSFSFTKSTVRVLVTALSC